MTVVRGVNHNAIAFFLHDRLDADFYVGNNINFEGTVIVEDNDNALLDLGAINGYAFGAGNREAQDIHEFVSTAKV